MASGTLTHGLRVASSREKIKPKPPNAVMNEVMVVGLNGEKPRHARLLKSRLRMSPGAHVNMTPIHIVSPKQMPQKCADNRKQQPDAETD